MFLLNFFYKFDPINKDLNFVSKTGIVIDEDSSLPFNQIDIELSKFDGEHRVSGVGSYILLSIIKGSRIDTLHKKSNSTSSYITDSTVYGGIGKIDLTYPGVNYSRIPKITNVVSGIGTDAI